MSIQGITTETRETKLLTHHADIPAGRALTLDAVELALELAPTELVRVGSTGTLFCLFRDSVLMEEERCTAAPALTVLVCPGAFFCSEPLLLLLLTLPSRAKTGSFFRLV